MYLRIFIDSTDIDMRSEIKNLDVEYQQLWRDAYKER